MSRFFSFEHIVSDRRVRVEFGNSVSEGGEKFPIQVEARVTIGPDGRPQLLTNVVWSHGTYDDLSREEQELFRFIHDNFGLIPKLKEEV